MIEIGLLFHSKNIEKDLPSAIRRYKERMGAEPKTIFLSSVYPGVDMHGLKVLSGVVTKYHFVLTGELKYE